MAKVKITGHASGTGIFTITAPNSNTDRTITLPDASVTLGTDATKLPLAGGTLTGDLNLGDNVDINFGAGSDLKIHHDGSHSYITDAGTGNLNIRGENIIFQKADGSEKYMDLNADGAVELWHNNVKKVETTATGLSFTSDSIIENTAGYMQVIAEDTLYLKCDSDNAGGESIHFMHGTTTLCKMQENGISLFGTGVVTPTHGGIVTIGSQGTGAMLECKVSHTTAFGCVKFQNDNGEVGSISMLGSSVTFNTSSDYRLKENVDYTWDATTRLKQLKPARFNWIADDTNTLVDGFIAHEVSSVVPEAIAGEKDATNEDGSIKPQGIDQSKLVPLLVKTIQELEARITALEA